MSLRTQLMHVVILAMAALAPSDAIAHEAQADPRIIMVNGSGEVRVRPDSLSVDVGVETRAATVDQVRLQATRALTAVLDAVRALDLPGVQIQTRALSIAPIYAQNRDDSRPPRIVGYAASNHVAITIEGAPVDALGEHGARIVDAALTAGANSVGGLDFFLADPKPAEDQALEAALADAARDAAIIARATGVTLGDLQSVEETPGMRLMPRSITLPTSATPIEVEDVVISSAVVARWTFAPPPR